MGLRWKILFVTLLTPLTLGLASLWTVHVDVSHHVNTSSIHESLERSSSVFESMLMARSDALGTAARVIVQDPRFFSLVGLRESQRDGRYRRTVKGMARDFQKITRTDLFEVVDRRGRMLASTGRSISLPDARKPFVTSAIGGVMTSGLLVEGRVQFQVVVMPVLADKVVVGALILGSSLGPEMARELRNETRSEVTFVSGDVVTGSTLDNDADRATLLEALDGIGAQHDGDFSQTGITEIHGPVNTYFTVVRPIPRGDPARRQLYVMQRSADPEISFLKQMQGRLVLLGLLAVAFALAAGFIFSERITRPLKRLVEGAHEMERGNYEFPIEVRGRDEIGYLAERFLIMRQQERAYVSGLEEATRLKSSFISVASQALRSPISVIRGYCDLLADGTLGALQPHQKQALTGIHDSLSNLLKVADDATLMAQVRGDRVTIQREEQDLSSLVDAAMGMAVAQATNRDVEVKRREGPALGAGRVDAGMLTQAISNLIANGIRFTPDGGRVDVIPRVKDGELALEVRDNGVGIAEEALDAIFKNAFLLNEVDTHPGFGSLEFNKPGLGLGLSITRGIVEAHGGTISVTSKVGKGSAFVIRVPLDMERRLSEAA
jgi:signal transduction histidine kinase